MFSLINTDFLLLLRLRLCLGQSTEQLHGKYRESVMINILNKLDPGSDYWGQSHHPYNLTIRMTKGLSQHLERGVVMAREASF